MIFKYDNIKGGYNPKTIAGDAVVNTYSSKIDRSGDVIVAESGKKNLYDFIQSFAAECDINVLIKKFANGDVSALNQRSGNYLDTTEMPKTLAEVLNFTNSAKEFFNSLPLEEREKFDFSFEKYFLSLEEKARTETLKYEKVPEVEELTTALESEVKVNE